MKRLIKISCCVLFLANSLFSNAQRTYTTISLSNKVFTDTYEGGDLVGAYIKVVSIEFYIDGKYAGIINKSDLTDPYVSHITGIVNLTKEENSITIGVTYSHKEWNTFGTIHEFTSLYHPYEIGRVKFSASPSTKQTFNQFVELDASINVPWTFDYTIALSPFEPTILIPEKHCNKINGGLRLTPNNPDYYTYSGEKYQWQAGIYDTWEYSSEFGYFLNHLIAWLQNVYPGDYETSSFDNIQIAIRNTDYSFMIRKSDLYSDTNNTDAIATLLRDAIIDQNAELLTEEEKDFIYEHFNTAVSKQTSCPQPYDPFISTWSDIGYSSERDGLITFVPGNFLDPLTDTTTRIGFRARAFISGVPGPFSIVRPTDILPAAPDFTVSAKPSCVGSPTGEIEIKGITGVTAESYYLYNVAVDSNPYAYGYFTGSGIILPERFPVGAYSVYLFYGDKSIQGCSISETVSIGSENKLTYNISSLDATCPEKTDGQISVDVTSFARSYLIKLDGNIYNNTAAALTNLKAGIYPVEISDYCNTPAQNSYNIEIKKPSELIINSVIPESPYCLSNSDGKITAVISGGKNPFSFELINGSGTVINSEYGRTYDDKTFITSSLPGGNYSVRVRSEECQWKTSAVSLAPVQPVSFSASVQHVDCYGNNTGSISLSPAGGNNSYAYYLNQVPGSQPFTSLYSDTYLVRVQSTASECNDYKEEYVTVGTAPEIKVGFPEISNPSCFEGENGRITASATGGTGGYRYTWTSDVRYIPDFYNSNILSDLIAGNYSLSVTDSKNCTVSRSTILTDPPELIVESALPSDAACFGENGSVTISASGGSGGNVYSCFEDPGIVFTGSAPSLIVPAGEYYVQVKDKNGCLSEYTDMVLVTGPSSPLDFSWSSPEFNGFNISCSGDATGNISVEASGGNGFANDWSEYDGYSYSLSGSPYQPLNSFTGLHAGAFDIRVKDGRGCVVQKSVTLSEPDPISVNLVSSTPVKCFGEPTGEIIVSAAGGIENTYKYRLDRAELLTSGIFSNLYAGTYEIEVSDMNGCRKNIFPSVESLYPPISIIAAKKDVRCFGEDNGSITTTVTGGSGGFSYSWEIQSGEDWVALEGTGAGRTDVPPGFYRVKVTDGENCYRYGNADISEPALLQIAGASSSDVVCLGEKGSISIDATGGIPGYTYHCKADNGDVFESSSHILQLPAGIYAASLTDANGCAAVHPAALQITQPVSSLGFTAALSSYNGYSVSCYGDKDGLITLEASGGNGAGYSGYTYSIAGDPFQPGNAFGDLPAGAYTVAVSDARGCISQKNVILTEPGQIGISLLGVSKVKCFGASTGEIEVETSGGVPEYSFKLNDAPAASSGLFKYLPALTYTVEVSDLNGCKAALSATVEHKNPPISSILTPVSARCYGEQNGEIRTELTGGSGGFTTSWEKKTGTAWQPYQSDGANLSKVTAGLYRLNAVDSDNCPDADSAEVKEPEPLRISNVNIIDAICYGDSGSMIIEAAGGNGGYSFQYFPDNNKIYYDYSPPAPLPAGIYGLKVTDSKGCAHEDTRLYQITSPSAALAFNTILSGYGDYNVSCHGNNDGSVSVLASGGNEYGYTGYSYHLSGRQIQEESIFTGMEAGTYDLTVTDGRGCSLTKPVMLSEPESEITLKASSLKMPVCIYDFNGAVTLSAAGGSLPYQFSVNNGDYSSSPEFTDLPVNSYKFRVRDRNGCSEILDTSLVNLISEMTISGDVSDVRCFGGNTGAINVHITGGAAPFAYSWKEYLSSASSVTGLLKGSYTVLVSDSAGCHSEKMFAVNEPEMPLSLSAVSSPACVGLMDGVIDAAASGGTAPYRFAVDTKKEFPLPSSFNVYQGNHTVYVSDRNDCLAETGVYVNVKNTMPDINFMLATSRYELDTLVVIDVSVPAPERVTWEFSEDANVIDTSLSIARIRYNAAGLYPVKMTGLFGACTYTIEKLLYIAPFDPMVIGDGKNSEGIKSLKITPNPNDGAFELVIELFTRQHVNVKIFDLSSRLVYDKIYPADMEFIREIHLPETVMPGTYVLRATCENDARSVVFVISK